MVEGTCSICGKIITAEKDDEIVESAYGSICSIDCFDKLCDEILYVNRKQFNYTPKDGAMVITNGKLLYYFYTNSRDFITNETVTEEAFNECVELVGGSDYDKEIARRELLDIMTVVKSVELVG